MWQYFKYSAKLSARPEPVEGRRFDKLSDRAPDTFAVYPNILIDLNWKLCYILKGK